MPHYAFTASTPDGERLTGRINAGDRASAIRTLLSRNYVVTGIRGEGGGRVGRVKHELVISFTDQLGAMLAAGVTMAEGVEVMAEDSADPAMQVLLADIGDGLRNGSTLGEALARHPRTFPQQYRAMVSAAEVSGKMPEVLRSLAYGMRRAEALRRKITGAMYYPAFVISFTILVITGLVLFAVPQFEEVYRGFGGHQLPLPTRFLIAVVGLFWQIWPALLAGLCMASFAGYRYVQTPKGRRVLDRFLLTAPLIGPLNQKILVARFARNLAMLQAAGVPIALTLQLVAQSVGNAVLQDIIMESRTAVMQGESITGPLRRSGLFTRMCTSMMTVGEHAGALESMLDNVAAYYEEQVEITVASLLNLLEPIMLVFVGVGVGLIAIAMMLPIFKMATLVM